MRSLVMGWKRIREQQLCKLALSVWDKSGLFRSARSLKHRGVTCLVSILEVTLQLQALPEVHQALVDFARFSKRSTSRFGISRSLRT